RDTDGYAILLSGSDERELQPDLYGRLGERQHRRLELRLGDHRLYRLERWGGGRGSGSRGFTARRRCHCRPFRRCVQRIRLWVHSRDRLRRA
ncbi:unnamed protein product, partial [Ectocarpus sp. 12 AP-2014]